MSIFEEMMLNWLGKVLMMCGGFGLGISVFADRIARDMPFNPGFFQIAGIVASVALIIVGIAADEFLRTVKKMLEEHLNG